MDTTDAVTDATTKRTTEWTVDNPVDDLVEAIPDRFIEWSGILRGGILARVVADDTGRFFADEVKPDGTWVRPLSGPAREQARELADRLLQEPAALQWRS